MRRGLSESWLQHYQLMRVARWGQAHCCLKIWLHNRGPSVSFAAQYASILETFQTNTSATHESLCRQEETSALLPVFHFFGYDFSRHGMIDSHRQDIDRFPIMLVRQRHWSHAHTPTQGEGSMPIHIRHSYPYKSIHAMYYNLACIVVVSIISVVV